MTFLYTQFIYGKPVNCGTDSLRSRRWPADRWPFLS